MLGQEEAGVAGWAIYQIFALTFINTVSRMLSYTLEPMRMRRIDKHQELGIMLSICLESKSRPVDVLYVYQSTVLWPLSSVSSKVQVIFSRF
jgi:hypothetical protein